MSRPDEHTLIVQSSVVRRLLFGGIGLVLVLSFLAGVDWQNDFADGVVAGTIFYFSITAVCLGVAGWNTIVRLDRTGEKAYFIRRMLGIGLASSSTALPEIVAVVLKGVRLLRDGEQPRPGPMNQRFRSYVEHRSVYYKLYLETVTKRHFVDDSTDPAELEAAGRLVADFLRVPFRNEDL